MNIIYIADVLIKNIIKAVEPVNNEYEYMPYKGGRVYSIEGYLKYLYINKKCNHGFFEISAEGIEGQLPYVSSVMVQQYPNVDNCLSIERVSDISPMDFYLINKDRFSIFLGRINDTTIAISNLNHFKI